MNFSVMQNKQISNLKDTSDMMYTKSQKERILRVINYSLKRMIRKELEWPPKVSVRKAPLIIPM